MGLKFNRASKVSKFSYFLSGIVGRRIEVEENWEREKNIDDAKCKCFEAEKILFCLQTKKGKERDVFACISKRVFFKVG